MSQHPSLAAYVADHHARGAELVTGALRNGRELDPSAIIEVMTWLISATGTTRAVVAKADGTTDYGELVPATLAPQAKLTGAIVTLCAVLNALPMQGVTFSGGPPPA